MYLLGNLIWEFVSGNKGVINDIDIFLFDGISDFINNDESTFNFIKNKYEYSESEYLSLQFNKNTDNFYYITESIKEGIFNYVHYKSKTDNKSIIIESFDINEHVYHMTLKLILFFWTSDFEEFLITGKLKVVNLLTPNHTAIKLLKKVLS